MLEPDSFGDSIILKTASVLWGIRITVVQSSKDGPRVHRFRHQKPMKDVDMVLLFNGSAHGHYSACCKYTHTHTHPHTHTKHTLKMTVSIPVRNDNSLLECADVVNLPGHVTDDEEEPEDDDQPRSKKPRVCNGKRTLLYGKRTQLYGKGAENVRLTK